MIQMPTPRQTAPVPVKSTGTSWAIQGNRPVIEALKRVDVIVDCTVEGLIHAPEWPEIEDNGRTRLLVVCNEHPEILERTEPTAELGPRSARWASRCCATRTTCASPPRPAPTC
jgi:2,5-dihydroxypyridine 5,6-dioxygenase